MASNSNNESSTQLKGRFGSRKPRMRVMMPHQIFHFTIPKPEDYADMEEDDCDFSCDCSATEAKTSPEYDNFSFSVDSVCEIQHVHEAYSPEIAPEDGVHSVCDSCGNPEDDEDGVNSVSDSPKSESAPGLGTYSPPSDGYTCSTSAHHQSYQFQECYSREPLSPPRCASYFDCKLCRKMAREPVVTPCGHLYCGHCLDLWLHFFSTRMECPVCKSKVSDSLIIPIRQTVLDSGFNVPPPMPKGGVCF